MSAPQLAQIVFYLVYTSNVILLVQFTTPSGGKIPGISYQVRALLARGSLTPYYYWLLLVGRKLMVRGSSAAQPRFWPVLLVLAPSCGQDWVGCRRTPTISPCIYHRKSKKTLPKSFKTRSGRGRTGIRYSYILRSTYSLLNGPKVEC